jgi:Protein of unknown function (DUF2808)
MKFSNIFRRPLMPALMAAGVLLAGVGVPAISLAQNNSGFTFTWGEGPKGKEQLRYTLDYGTPGMMGDRYRFRMGVQNLAINRINITYPDYYDGTFDPKAIEIRVGAPQRAGFLNLRREYGRAIPLTQVNYDPKSRVIDLVPAEVIPAGEQVEIVLSNVRNPPVGGMYYFNARVESPGDVPLMRYVGTWIVSIHRP